MPRAGPRWSDGRATGPSAWSLSSAAAYSAAKAAVVLVWRGAVQGVKWAWALVPLAILLNPIAPIHLSRETWQTVDIAAAVVLVSAVILMEAAILLRRSV